MKKTLALLLASLLLFTFSAASLAEGETPDEPAYGPKVACILYTTRAQQGEISAAKVAAGMDKAQADKEACFEVMEAVAEMGYNGVQLWTANFTIPAAELKAKAEELGLELVVPHFHNIPSWTEEDWQKNLAYLQDLGVTGIVHPYETAPGYDGSKPLTQAQLENWVVSLGDTLQHGLDMIEKYAPGMRLYYHSHSAEMIMIDSLGMTLMDALYARFGDKIGLQIDSGWATWCMGGETAFGYTPLGNEGIQKYWMKRGEQYTESIHLKDVDFVTSSPRAIGQGDIDWDHLFPLFRQNNLQWVIVENDNPEKANRTGLEDLEASINYIKALYTTLGWTWQD